MAELLNNPDTAPSLQRMFALLDQGIQANPQLQNFALTLVPSLSPTQANGALRPSPVNTNLEDMASKLPKGLRVEDLKPPPSKRSKGKAGNANGTGNASSPITMSTPDPKTPLNLVGIDSPGQSSSSAKKASQGQVQAQGQGKRKRQASIAVKPSSGETPDPNTEFLSMGLDLTSSATNMADHKPFFDAQTALLKGEVADPWSALTSALEDWQAAKVASGDVLPGSQNGAGAGASLGEALGLYPPANTVNASTDLNSSSINMAQLPQPNSLVNLTLSNLGLNLPMSLASGSGSSGNGTGASSGGPIALQANANATAVEDADDLFDRFMDFSDASASGIGSSSEFYLYPTPELLRDGDDPAESSDNFSPESSSARATRDRGGEREIVQTPQNHLHGKAVGVSPVAMFDFGTGTGASAGAGTGTGAGVDGTPRSSSSLTANRTGGGGAIEASPGSKAFNGGLFWDDLEDGDEGFDVGYGIGAGVGVGVRG